jgi:2,4-diketo-3-deoxy-L-fuconate hydrolase
MKLIRCEKPGKGELGLVINDKFYYTSSIMNDYDDEFFTNNGINKL